MLRPSPSVTAAKDLVSSQKRELLSNLAAHVNSKMDEGSLSVLGVYQSVLGELAALDLDTDRGTHIRASAKLGRRG